MAGWVCLQGGAPVGQRIMQQSRHLIGCRPSSHWLCSLRVAARACWRHASTIGAAAAAAAATGGPLVDGDHGTRFASIRLGYLRRVDATWHADNAGARPSVPRWDACTSDKHPTQFPGSEPKWREITRAVCMILNLIG